jgi:hypothetical protein
MLLVIWPDVVFCIPPARKQTTNDTERREEDFTTDGSGA